MVESTVLVSAIAGLGSFVSPCILPILPAFISYLSGTTINEIQSSGTTINEIKGTNGPSRNLTGHHQQQEPFSIKKSTRLNIFLNTVYFVLGFSLVFAVLGVILNSVFVVVGNGFQHSLTSTGGIVIIAFGVYLILSTKLRTLNFEKKMMTKTTKIQDKLYYIVCVWSCICWMLDSLCWSDFRQYLSLSSYCSWSSIQFIVGILIRIRSTISDYRCFLFRATGIIRRMVKHLKYFNLAMGAMLVIVGILVFTNQLVLLGNFPLVNQIAQSGGRPFRSLI